MCGIVGAVSKKNVRDRLLEGLKRLEYRGYDSAGIALTDSQQHLQRVRSLGKVQALVDELKRNPIDGTTGIAHTRWATHGVPSELNAHPHMSNLDIALVHNGIIENHEAIKKELIAEGFKFLSDTDTEVAVHLLQHLIKQESDFLLATRMMASQLHGAFSLGIIFSKDPHRLLAVRQGSPLVVGFGDNETFIASDPLALQGFVSEFLYLEEGDIADVQESGVTVFDKSGEPVERQRQPLGARAAASEKGEYDHFMMKEIFEQPKVISDTLEGKISESTVFDEAFGTQAAKVFDKVERIQIIACGTSYHAGLVAKYWLEDLASLPCAVEVASEIRYRKIVVQPNTLLITISQSGETADTLAALRQAKELGYLSTLTICNVPTSSLVRESDLKFLTRAGVEIGVASTKAFVTQLTALLLLTVVLGRRHGLSAEREKNIVETLHNLPRRIQKALDLNLKIKELSKLYANKQHALFLGRGVFYPIALEGALKLKEISYIHAEAYPAGELKHGPLALVDKDMPIVAIAPSDDLLDKLKSNLEEVRARGGELHVFTDHAAPFKNIESVLQMQPVENEIAPIVFTVPLQLLAYHVAVIKGTDVDQPRNLAKSVTVE